MIIKLGKLLGRGGFANVYRALDPKDDTPLPIAIKKSRVSQRVRRPHLQHEACLLRSLEGHSAIPRVVAYGHLQHFEYLALELLGRNLEEITPKNGMDERMVANFAIQLLSALEFIHSHGVIHRDIKPSNVLLSLDQTPTLRLIDFGIARPFRLGVPTCNDPLQKRQNIPGTLHWISLNVHLGYDTSRRDDLESLSYTLLFLLRGSLPWQLYKNRSGTLAGNMKQVREKKKRWPGQRLGEGFAKEFGELLDYARALEFESKPDYVGLMSGFQRLLDSKQADLDFSLMMEPSPESPHSHSRLSHKLPIRSFPAPVSPGQLIYVKLLSRLSIEGYAMQALDPSYWEDASLLRPELETKKRPAVVLDVKKLDRDTYWKVKVLPIRRGSARGKEGGDAAAISLSPQRLETGAIEEWSWAEIVAFAFPCAETFVCLPNQPILTPGRWSVPASTCAGLSQLFDRRLHSNSTSADEQLRVRIHNNMTCNMYVALSPLEDPHLEDVQEGDNVTWDGTRGWLDEMAKVARRRVFEKMHEWSSSENLGSVMEKNEDVTEDVPSDSNSDPYMTEWWPLGGRDISVTFGEGFETNATKQLCQSIERIESVIKKR